MVIQKLIQEDQWEQGCSYFSIAWTLANVSVIGDMILYSNTIFEMLESLGCHRNILKLGWQASKWHSSDWFSCWHNSSLVSVMMSQANCCALKEAQNPVSKGFRAVQLWPCSYGTRYSENLLYESGTFPTCLTILPVHSLSNSTCKKNSDRAKMYQ